MGRTVSLEHQPFPSSDLQIPWDLTDPYAGGAG